MIPLTLIIFRFVKQHLLAHGIIIIIFCHLIASDISINKHCLINGSYAHTEAGLESGYNCTVTYEGMADGAAQAACTCVIAP